MKESMVTHLFPQTKFPLHSPGISTRASWHVTVEYVSLLVLLKLVRRHEVILYYSNHFFFLFFLFLKFLFLVTTPFPVEFHGIEGAEVLSKENPSFENHKESMKIVELVENLCDDGGFGFNLTSICVVAFYPAQVKFKFLFGYWTFYCRKPWNLEIKIECSNVEYRYQQSV